MTTDHTAEATIITPDHIRELHTADFGSEEAVLALVDDEPQVWTRITAADHGARVLTTAADVWEYCGGDLDDALAEQLAADLSAEIAQRDAEHADADPAAERIRAARDAAHAAHAAFEQTVRDAVTSGDATPSDVARALGTRNRQRVYAILGRGDNGDEPRRPSLPPVVYLRGQGMSSGTWRRVEHAMWARGWVTVRDRTDAWHLARGGVPVVLCDFSASLDDSEPTPDGGALVGYHRYVVVGQVRARWEDTTVTAEVGDLLPSAERARLIRDRAEWLSTRIETTRTEMDLPMISGGRSDEPWQHGHLDEQALARLVGHLVDSTS